MCDFFNFHSASNRCHNEEISISSIEQNCQVVLALNRSSLGNHHFVNDVSLDIHSKDCRSFHSCICTIDCEFYAARFTSTADFNLGFNDNFAAHRVRCSFCFFWCCCNGAGQNRNPVRFKKISSLILEEIHYLPRFVDNEVPLNSSG